MWWPLHARDPLTWADEGSLTVLLVDRGADLAASEVGLAVVCLVLWPVQVAMLRIGQCASQGSRGDELLILYISGLDRSKPLGCNRLAFTLLCLEQCARYHLSFFHLHF